jgi:Na+/melibiose symporter-like transporter
MSFVDTRKRASFGAGKEMVSLISGMVFVLVMGFVIDKFAADDNVEGGFIFIGISILVCSILDLITLLIMKNPKVEKSESADEPIFSVIKKLFSNKGFICLLVASVLWYVATGMTTGFMGIYKTSPTELGFKVGEVQIINTVGCLCRFAVSKPCGKFSDKTSYATGILLGTSVAAACFAINMFTCPENKWLIYVYTVLYNCSLAAIHQNFFNITFDLVETKYFVQASSVKAALSGVCGFGASLVGAAILSGVQTNGNSFMGIDTRGQQLLSAISAAIMIVLVLFVLLVLRKQKKIEQ